MLGEYVARACCCAAGVLEGSAPSGVRVPALSCLTPLLAAPAKHGFARPRVIGRAWRRGGRSRRSRRVCRWAAPPLRTQPPHFSRLAHPVLYCPVHRQQDAQLSAAWNTCVRCVFFPCRQPMQDSTTSAALTAPDRALPPPRAPPPPERVAELGALTAALADKQLLGRAAHAAELGGQAAELAFSLVRRERARHPRLGPPSGSIHCSGRAAGGSPAFSHLTSLTHARPSSSAPVRRGLAGGRQAARVRGVRVA